MIESISKKYDNYYLKTYKDKFILGRLKNELKCILNLTDKVNNSFKEINDYRIIIIRYIFQNGISLYSFENQDV